VDTEAERPRDGQQKLTFYQTLTAPLGPPASYPTPPTASSDGKAKPSPAPPRERTTLAGASAAGGQGTEPTAPRSDDTPRAAAAPVSTGAANASWSVQVGVFGTRPQADVLERQLRGAGFEAYVSTLGAADGQTRYRVRVGPFRSRGEAERVAERVRSERSLPTYVATN
jgi:DedD protein